MCLATLSMYSVWLCTQCAQLCNLVAVIYRALQRVVRVTREDGAVGAAVLQTARRQTSIHEITTTQKHAQK